MAERILHSGSFTDYEGGQVKVTFWKEGSGSQQQNDLTFSGESPVVINYNGDANDIYAPVKTSSCDVSIVSKSILDDLYTASKDEIRMKVEKDATITTQVLVWSSNGSAATTQIGTQTLESYVIYTAKQFYTDINGDYRFSGQIVPEDGGTAETVNLKYDHTNNKWVRDNAWNLNFGDQYFHDGTRSYRVSYNGTRHKVQEWTGSDWGTEYDYNVYRDGSSQDCTYDCQHIVYFKDGNIELLYAKLRFTWNRSNHRWQQASYYTSTTGGDFSSAYGFNYQRVRNSGGTVVDAIAVTGYANGGIAQNYIVQLNRSAGTFTPIAPLSIGNSDITHLFTDDDGYLYWLNTNGDIYFWASNISQWIKWVTFTGDYVQNGFTISYLIPGTHKTAVIAYLDTAEGSEQYFYLSNITHPSVYYRTSTISGASETIWEGYKVPNTYSQEVTPNLDTIGMTGIDPVSILKYITIDKIFDKPNVVTYGQLIGKILSYVQLRASTPLMIERALTYGSNNYTGTNGLLNLKVQVSNFWNEAEEGSTLYQVMEELLRPFCLTLVYLKTSFQIYNMNKMSGTRTFDNYLIQSNGSLTTTGTSTETNQVYTFNYNDWKSNNTTTPTIEIGSTYEKVTGVASTSIPSYNKDIKDEVDMEDPENYGIQQLNIQRNKHKGYRLVQGTSNNHWEADSDDYWFFLWNAVYRNVDYDLQVYDESHPSTHSVDGWVNINGAYDYYYGSTGYPGRYGSVLNYYGGDDNPTGTGKVQSTDKSVDITSRITAYATDNGIPPEFMEADDLVWNFSNTSYTTEQLTKSDYSDTSKFGTGKTATDYPTRKVFKQSYNNMTLYEQNKQTVSLNIRQSYSRTGVDVPIDVMTGNANTSKTLTLGIENRKYTADLNTATGPGYFWPWKSDRVEVDDLYFSRYRPTNWSTSTGLITQVWDKRRVYMYVDLGNGTIYQFDGRQWVQDTQVRDSNCFFLMKLMNYQTLYHTDYQYNVIQVAEYDDLSEERRRYSLTDENIIFYTNGNSAVTKDNSGTAHTYTPYNAPANSWYDLIDKCGDGELSVILPYVGAINATVTVEFSCSSMLGMTGGDPLHNDSLLNTKTVTWVYEVVGTGTYNGQTITLDDSNCNHYGEIALETCKIDFLPACANYVKAEHLDISVGVSVPESNLGKMFSSSDIKYTISNNNNYVEEFEGPSFQVNTYNSLVTSSYSYLIFDNDVADPGSFVINGVAARPESYVVQAYMNWLGTIRKVYSKTLVPTNSNYRWFSNVRTFITSPETGNNTLMVVGDSYDVKTNRHTVTAIECQNMEVSSTGNVSVKELPRKARAARWNYISAKS